MIGIIIQLLLTWLLVWLFYRGNLSVLGLYPAGRRLSDFFFYFLLATGCSASTFILRHLIAHQTWSLNPHISWPLIAEGLLWNIRSVLFEELIFRGAVFYILLRKLGTIPAILVSATAFGIYHWFSYEVLGQPLQMLILFIATGVMGVIYAYAYAKNWSLYVPIAIHLGWNCVQSVLFSNTSIGQQVLIKSAPDPERTISYLSYFTMQFLPLILIWVSAGWLLYKKRQEAAPDFSNFI